MIATIWTEKSHLRDHVVPVAHVHEVEDVIETTAIETTAIEMIVIAIRLTESQLAADRRTEIPEEAIGVLSVRLVVEDRAIIVIEETRVTVAIEIILEAKNRHSTRKCQHGTKRSKA